MEILTLLRLNGRRLGALVTIGALTGALAAAAVSRQASSYDAGTTVFVGQALPEGASAFDVGPLTSDFQRAIGLPQVRQEAAERLGISADDIEVSASRNGNDGGSVEVVATAGSAADAEAVSQTVSTETMRFLAQRQVDRAVKAEEERRSEVERAQTEVDRHLAENGFANPTETYNQTMTRYLQLTLDKSDPTNAFTNEQRIAADAESNRLRLQLPALQQLSNEFSVAQQELDDAKAALQAARLSRVSAEEVLVAATTEVAISAGETVRASRIPLMLQAFAAAMIATFVVGIAFFFLVDGARRRKSRGRAGNRPDRPAAAPTGAGAAAASAPSGAAARSTTTTAPNGAAPTRTAPDPTSIEALEAELEAEGDTVIDVRDPTIAGRTVRRSADASAAESVFARPKGSAPSATGTADRPTGSASTSRNGDRAKGPTGGDSSGDRRG